MGRKEILSGDDREVAGANGSPSVFPCAESAAPMEVGYKPDMEEVWLDWAEVLTHPTSHVG